MAVYTFLSDTEVETLLEAYDLGRLVSLKGIAEGVENSNYFLLTTQGMHILTLFEQRVRREDLPFFLGLKEHLALKGLRCPQPVRAQDGLLWREVQGRAACIITFLPGTWPHHVEEWHLAELGVATARLHEAAADYPLTRANALDMKDWRPLFNRFADRVDGAIAPGWRALIEEELAFLESHWPEEGALPSGIIHADLFPDNVFFEEGKLTGIIDFYFACRGFYAYELAIVVNAWCFARVQGSGFGGQGLEEGPLPIPPPLARERGPEEMPLTTSDTDSKGAMAHPVPSPATRGRDREGVLPTHPSSLIPHLSRALFAAYQQQRSLTRAEKDAFPVLVRGAALRFLLTRAHDWIFHPPGAMVVPKDPREYMAKLQFHRKGQADYGIE
jgi:homoserine kinase type II